MTNPATLGAATRMLADLKSFAASPHDVPFGRIVQARKIGRISELADEALSVEVTLTQHFEAVEGPIQNSYFCRKALGACAVAGPPPPSPGGTAQQSLRLHTVLNSDDARLIALEARCNDMSDQIVDTLAGRPSYARQMRGAVMAIYSVMTRVLSAADQQAASADPVRVTASVQAAQAELDAAQRRAEILLQRWARSIYLQGVLVGTLVAFVLVAAFGVATSHLWWRLIPTAPTVLATTFGALGAVVSVFQRMSTGKLVLDVTAAQRDIRAIAVLRPLVGAVFGAVTSFALSGGLLQSGAGQGGPSSPGLFAVAGFAAGFSERLAVDMVERAGRMLFGDPTKAYPAGPQPPAGGLAAPVAADAHQSMPANGNAPAPPAKRDPPSVAAPTPGRADFPDPAVSADD
jgi:hypothetical protein